MSDPASWTEQPMVCLQCGRTYGYKVMGGVGHGYCSQTCLDVFKVKMGIPVK